ncbi:SDR family NAD(P)-dependent oxidoreductase [Nostocoides australiense]
MTHRIPERRPAASGLALVVGASRGLCMAIAADLTQRGHPVVICARTGDDLETAQAQLTVRRPGATVHTRVVDIGDEHAVDALVADVEETLGPIDIAIAVAGTIQVGPAETMTTEEFRDAMGTMAWGPIHLAWSVLPAMRRRGHGRIGVITSIGGMVSPPHLLPYATAKFAAVGFSDGLAAALSGTGVTATTVVPGLMRTGSHRRAQFAGDAAAEYAWFAPAASLPLLSMDVERAAARIVAGVLRGRPMVILTPLAKVGVRVRGLMPATTTRVMGRANRLLPESDRAPRELGTIRPRLVEGGEADRRLGSPLVRRLTVLGERAADTWNERRGERKEQLS